MSKEDFQAFWPVFKAVVAARETYAFDPDMEFESAYQLWCVSPQRTFVMKENDRIWGSYYIRPSAAGPGSHISNCEPGREI